MTFKFQMDDYINYIDFILGGDKDAYDSIEDSHAQLKVIYNWESGIGRAIDEELCNDFERCISFCDFDNFLKLFKEINEKDWAATTPIFAEIYYEDKYLGSLLINEETFHLITEWHDENE